MRKILLTSAIVLAMTNVAAHAAETATLSVIGSITPAACDATLSSDSVNLGTIAASQLTNDYTVFNPSAITLNLSCDAATAIAIQTTDNRSASAMTSTETESDMALVSTDENTFGLGTDSASNKIGTLSFAITDGTTNGATNTTLLVNADATDTGGWSSTTISAASPYLLNKNQYFALAESADSATPAAVTTATYTMEPSVALKKSSKYPSGETVNIDGNVTFSIVYL